MHKLVLLTSVVVSSALKFNDAGLSNQHNRISSERNGNRSGSRNSKVGDYRTSASASVSGSGIGSITSGSTVDLEYLKSCQDCEYLISPFSNQQTNCLTSAGDGYSRCSLYEDQLGFKFQHIAGPNNRDYFQIVNTIDNMCLQDIPEKIHTQGIFLKSLTSILPRLRDQYDADSPQSQSLITAIWRHKLINTKRMQQIYGSCVPRSMRSLHSYQVWQVEKVAYGTKQFLIRNLRTNRCLHLDTEGKFSNVPFGVSDCTNPDAASPNEASLQSFQALSIQARPPAVALKQAGHNGGSKCLQMLGGRPVLSECVTGVVSSKVVQSGGKHDGKSFDFVPAGGCTTQTIRTKSGLQQKHMCAQTLQVYSSNQVSVDAKASRVERYCLIVDRATYKDSPDPILGLKLEKCAAGSASPDPNATPLARRGSFATSEGTRQQTWWIEKEESAGGDKIIPRFRFWDGSAACLVHTATEVRVIGCHLVDSGEVESTWAMEPVYVSRG